MTESPKTGAELTPEVLEVLRTRAERARELKDVAEEAEAALPVAEFPVGKDTYAIALKSLRAVVSLRQVAPVPLAPPHVLGLLRFQNQLVSALSLMALLGVRGWRQDCAVLLVVDVGEGHLVAVDCEQVPRIGALPLAQVEAARSRGQGAVLDVCAGGVRQVGLIDVRALVDSGAVRGGERG